MFRFAIRDVLWLTLVVGVAVGWLVDRRDLAVARDRAQSNYLKTEERLEKTELYLAKLKMVFEANFDPISR